MYSTKSRTGALRAKWQAVKKRVKATWLWRVFVVCAMRRLWTKFLVAISLVSSYGALMFGLDLITPRPPLE
ncbi:MAG: hypothetical protein WC383_02205 [Gammaproteobacteria bacterium]